MDFHQCQIINTCLNNNESDNTATGVFSLYTNSGYRNTATGVYTLFNSYGAYYNSANDNTVNGAQAMYANVFGGFNTAVGNYALYGDDGAYYNTAVGYAAGMFYQNGDNNVFLGANVDVNGDGYTNDMAIGQGTLCTDANQVRIGNSSTVSIGGYSNWSNLSDVRVKKNIKQNVPGLAFINKLQPITYNLDLNTADKIIQRPLMKNKDGKFMQLTKQESDERKAKEQIIYTGFAAQDVEKKSKELNYNFSGVDAAKNNKDLYALRYAEFVVPLVKAVQELSVKNEKLKNEIDTQQKINQDLQKQIDNLKTMISTSSTQ